MLLQRGARVTCEEPDDGETSVHLASATGRVEVLEELLKADGKEALSKFDECGWTPLHLAVFYSQLECVRVLLSHGADPNLREAETSGRTAFQLGEKGKNTEILSLLSEAGGCR